MDEHMKKKGPRKIFGVPVIPGLPNLPLTIDPSSDGDDVTESPSTPRRRTPSTSSTPSTPTQVPWTLGHKDFHPKQLKEKNEDGFEQFKTVVEHANEWLKENVYVRLFTCESVLWSTVERPLYTDNGILMKSMNTEKKTKYYRGLRIWYYTTDDTFYDSKSTSHPMATLSYRNYGVEAKADTIRSILSRANADFIKNSSPGRVMRLETLPIPSEMDLDDCFWKEEPQKDKNFNFFLRAFHVVRADLKPERTPELGIQDFFPEFTQRTPHNQGYETYPDMWKRAARWIYQNAGLKMLNIQSVFVKYKKDTSETDIALRCNYTEHGSAYGSIHQNRTEYLQVLRVVYMKKIPSGVEKPESERVKLAYKMFSPIKLHRDMPVTREDELNEGGYEDLGQLQDRANTWLQKIVRVKHWKLRLSSIAFSLLVMGQSQKDTGRQQLVGMETIPVRLLSGGQETLGSDCTFLCNTKERNLNREPWRVNIRLYLTGRNQDLPPSGHPVSRSRSSLSSF